MTATVATNELPSEGAAAPLPAEFKGSDEGSLIRSVTAMVIWLGTIHFNVVVVLLSFFFLPLHLTLLFVLSLSNSILKD